MLNFLLIRSNIIKIFRSWNKLDDEQKHKKINVILPFVQLHSYLFALNFISNQEISQEEIKIIENGGLGCYPRSG